MIHSKRHAKRTLVSALMLKFESMKGDAPRPWRQGRGLPQTVGSSGLLSSQIVQMAWKGPFLGGRRARGCGKEGLRLATQCMDGMGKRVRSSQRKDASQVAVGCCAAQETTRSDSR